MLMRKKGGNDERKTLIGGQLDLQCLIDKLYSKIMTTVQENGRCHTPCSIYEHDKKLCYCMHEQLYGCTVTCLPEYLHLFADISEDPFPTIAIVGETANFRCTVTIGRIYWFVNRTTPEDLLPAVRNSIRTNYTMNAGDLDR